MSTEEKDAQIGKLIRERKEASDARLLLGQQLNEIAHAMGEVAKHLGTDAHSYPGPTKSAQARADLVALADKEAILDILDRYDAATQRVADIGKALSELGV